MKKKVKSCTRKEINEQQDNIKKIQKYYLFKDVTIEKAILSHFF